MSRIKCPFLLLFLSHLFIFKHVQDKVCGFEDERICGFTQDRTDVFDWTRQNNLTQNPKRSTNTGPETDRSGTKEGENSFWGALEERCYP